MDDGIVFVSSWWNKFYKFDRIMKLWRNLCVIIRIIWLRFDIIFSICYLPSTWVEWCFQPFCIVLGWISDIFRYATIYICCGCIIEYIIRLMISCWSLRYPLSFINIIFWKYTVPEKVSWIVYKNVCKDWSYEGIWHNYE